jgi:hypothetical protein
VEIRVAKHLRHPRAITLQEENAGPSFYEKTLQNPCPIRVHPCAIELAQVFTKQQGKPGVPGFPFSNLSICRIGSGSSTRIRN